MPDGERTFDWPRYWFPLDEDISSFTQDGYLSLPNDEYKPYYPAAPATLEELTNTSALLLLGDPGSGKSQALVDEKIRLEAVGKEVLYLDLRSAGEGDKQDLREKLLTAARREHEPNAQSWVLIDSLDECGFSSPGEWLARTFVDEILNAEHLAIRIASRHGSWIDRLRLALERKFGEAAVKTLRICPLRQGDVLLAAREMDVDGKQYLDAIAQRQVEELAALPVTGRFMLQLFKRNDLPEDRAAIFEKGLLLLCEDSPRRRESDKTGDIPAKIRFVSAARMAFGALLAGKLDVWAGPEAECPEYLFDARVVVGADRRKGSIIEIDQTALRETFDLTGIFTRLDQNRYRFSSKTFAEYLMAWYLASSYAPLKQQLTLLLHPEDQRLIPDLHESAAWLASLDEVFLDWIVEHEPLAILEADIATLKKCDLPKLVTALLEIADAEERDSHDRSRLSKLAHPGLSKQLQNVLRGNDVSPTAKALACRIANACNCKELSDTLADMALDNLGEAGLRALAVVVVGNLGNDESTSRLLPLVAPDNPQRLRGMALGVLGPRLMSGQEFFAQIAPQNLDSLPSDFRYSISETAFCESLSNADLIAGLNWIVANAPFPYDDFYAKRLKNGLLAAAFRRIDKPAILEALGETLVSLRKDHHDIFEDFSSDKTESWTSNSGTRRRLFRTLLTRLDPDRVGQWAYGLSSVAKQEDLIWFLNLLDTELSGAEYRVATAFINDLLDRDTPAELLSRVLNRAGVDAVPRDMVLAGRVGWLVEPMLFDDPRTQSTRSQHFKSITAKEESRRRRKSRKLPKPPLAYITERLQTCEDGDLSCWPSLGMALTYTEDGGNGFPHHPEQLPGWKMASDEIRGRIANIAFRFLMETDPPTTEVLLKSQYTFEEVAGGFALEILDAAHALDRLPVGVWRKWCLTVVTRHIDPSERRESIFRLVKAKVASDFDAAALVVLDHEATGEHIHLIYHLAPVLDSALGEKLAERLNRPTWTFSARLKLAEFLLDRGEDRAVHSMKRWLTEETDLDRCRSVARVLVQKALASAWPEVSQILAGEPEFARQILLGTARDATWRGWNSSGLRETQIAWLYDRAHALFPPDEDPPHPDGPHTPTTRDDVAHFRDGFLYRLAAMGTKTSVQEVARIRDAYPQSPWLKRVYADACQSLWRKERSAVSFRHAIRLLHDDSTRVVRSSRELMAVVEEALTRFAQECLQGSPPLVVFLWDEVERRPVKEQRLSDFLKFYLAREWLGGRIILNREVEIQNWRDFGIGNRTDLLVQSPSMDTDRKIATVVIEVKCDDNLDESDIPQQLVAKYLDEHLKPCGIYLVGWFGRRKKESLDDCQTRLDCIALENSTGRVQVSAHVIDLTHPLSSTPT